MPAQRITLHPITPEARLMKKIADIFESGGLMVYPTDSGYALGCNATHRKAVNKLYHLKRGIKKYIMALMVQDFSSITEFARVDNAAFRYMKHKVPGPYTFILPATLKGTKTLDVNRKELGVRVPDHVFLKRLYELAPHPILNTAARIREDDQFTDPDELEENFMHQVDCIVDFGIIPIHPTTVINFMDGAPEVLRQGAGEV